ncbi:fimbrial protein [Burkholderia gladioli]|uniref:fimbrial protein n=1 Tax=Burkholderia gladioli TaxID=28095 RepID=UPI001FC8BF80|nr:fimbrial protein [Burkholderia gladioli]
MKKQLLSDCLLAGICSPAWSVRCTSFTNDSLNYYIAHVDGFRPPQEFDPGSIPIGGVIYRSSDGGISSLNKSGSLASSWCSLDIPSQKIDIGVPNDGIYPTSIPNIGMRISDIPSPRTGNTADDVNMFWKENVPTTIELVKTGEITAGGYLSGPYAQFRADSLNGQLTVEFRFPSPIRIQPRIPTCRVATPHVKVPMGNISAAMFTGIGSTTFARRFEIGQACSGGNPGTATNAWVTLTDASQPGNTSTSLSLPRESTAPGIGVQLHRDDTMLGFGADSDAIGNTNQWHMGRIAQGQAGLTVPLTTGCVQTGAKVGAGSANAHATSRSTTSKGLRLLRRLKMTKPPSLQGPLRAAPSRHV